MHAQLRKRCMYKRDDGSSKDSELHFFFRAIKLRFISRVGGVFVVGESELKTSASWQVQLVSPKLIKPIKNSPSDMFD